MSRGRNSYALASIEISFCEKEAAPTGLHSREQVFQVMPRRVAQAVGVTDGVEPRRPSRPRTAIVDLIIAEAFGLSRASSQDAVMRRRHIGRHGDRRAHAQVASNPR